MWLPEALSQGRPEARGLLESCVEPIANMLRTMWALDPHLDLVGLGGGVVEGLGGYYRDELHRQLKAFSTYADPGYSDEWLRDRLILCERGSVDLLAGAANAVSWLPGIVR
jgi:glucokinase